MTSCTFKRAWIAFVAVLFALLGLASPALALNGHPAEGEHYKIVKGPSPKSTYLKVTPGVNINTPLLAEALGTTPQDIRADNPTKTLALCHVRGDGYRMGKGIDSPDKRASNAVWQTCSQSDQYVYIIPGEVIEVTGMKRLSFDQEQKILSELKACADEACVMDKAKALGAKAAGSHATPITQVPSVKIEGVPPPPVVQDNAAALDSLTRERDAARADAGQTSKWFWYSILFSGCALAFAIVMGGLRKSWISRFEYLQDEKESLQSVKDGLRDSLQNHKKDRAKALDEQRKQFKAECASLEASVTEKDRLLKVKDAELVTARTSTDTLRGLLNGKEIETRSWRQRFAQFVTDLRVKLGDVPFSVPDGSDFAEEMHEVLARVDAHDESLRAVTLRLGQIIDGRGPDTQSHRFDFTGLYELMELLNVSLNEMEPFCDGDVVTVVGRVHDCCSDSALSRTRDALHKRDEQLATLKTEPPPCDDAETHGRLLAENAKLVTENVKLETRVAGLEDEVAQLLTQKRSRPPVTAPYPELPRPSQPPVIEGTRPPPRSPR